MEATEAIYRITTTRPIVGVKFSYHSEDELEEMLARFRSFHGWTVDKVEMLVGSPVDVTDLHG